jgi:hypothetical protein
MPHEGVKWGAEKKLERAVSGSGEGHAGMVSGAVDGEERAGAAAFWVDGEGCSDFGVLLVEQDPPHQWWRSTRPYHHVRINTN